MGELEAFAGLGSALDISVAYDSEIPEISILRTFRSHACPTGEEFVHHSFEVFVRCLQGGRCTICIGLHKSAFSRRHSIENVVIVLELCALL